MARVLLVDDNQLVLSMLSDILRRSGYTVDLAENGNQALAKMRLILPDIVITDFYMPGLEGDALVAIMRSDRTGLSTIPVIGLAGTQDSERKLRAAGVDIFLSKPFREKELLRGIEALLKR